MGKNTGRNIPEIVIPEAIPENLKYFLELAVYMHCQPNWEAKQIEKSINDFLEIVDSLPEEAQHVIGVGAEFATQLYCNQDRSDDPEEANRLLGEFMDQLSMRM